MQSAQPGDVDVPAYQHRPPEARNQRRRPQKDAKRDFKIPVDQDCRVPRPAA